MHNPITSVSGNAQPQLPSCKWKGGETLRARALSRKSSSWRNVTAELPHVPRHRQGTSAVSRNSCLHTEGLPQPACPAWYGPCTPEQLVPSHERFWASPLTRIGFAVEETWTCSGGKPRQESRRAARWHFWARSQQVKTRGQGTADTQDLLAVPEAGEISTFLISR